MRTMRTPRTTVTRQTARTGSVLGQRLLDRRTRKGLSLRDVADELKISAMTLSRIERGLQVPYRTTARKIETYLRRKG
jgi:transcriptional regulator with XRE-family HTH domain